MKTRMVIAALSLLTFLCACAEKTAVQPTPAEPAAMGEVKTSRDPNGNTALHLVVRHVAPPQNLQPPKNSYVVWVESPEGQYTSLGQLKIGNNRDGEITGVTPLKQFRLVVTAEDFGTVTAPSDQVVLKTEPIEAK